MVGSVKLAQPRTKALVLICLCAAGACGGNRYGYARTYEPIGDERDWLERAETVGYEQVRRNPETSKDRLLSWFGLVTKIESSGPKARATMTLRLHQARHLCAGESSSSCRVTVSEKAMGPFTALLDMRPEDAKGRQRIWGGSLLRVYGRPTGEFDDQGGPIVAVSYYRHWPLGTYVTTGARRVLRR